jgi:cation:H+ antiporter
VDVLVLLLALAIILVGAELFTNGIEWFGHKLDLAEGAVGSVLAAVGTALPETMIPLIAILFGGSHGADEIGIGAVLGAPFMLATLAMFVTGAAILGFRRRRSNGSVVAVDRGVLVHDIRWFLIGYGIALGAAFLPPDLVVGRWAAAITLLVLYAWYVRGHLAAESRAEATDALPPLRMRRLDRRHRDRTTPRLRIVTFQVVVALGCIIAGAGVFVGAVEHLAGTLGVDGTILSLVIAPIATELPEKFNSVIWVRQGKDTLALGNITGAMVFQSAIPTSVALLFAPTAWAVTGDSWIAFLSAAIAVASIAAIVVPMRLRGRLSGGGLTVGGAFYALYLGLVVIAIAA